jgi:Zn-dependent M28 family amino/carboxypeptidase
MNVARKTVSPPGRFVAGFIVLLNLVTLSGRDSSGEGRLPADLGVKAKRHIEALVKFAPRQAGSLNESRAAEYIAGQFMAIGVPAVIELFSFESFEPSRVDLKIGGENFAPAGLGMDPYARGLAYSGAFVFLDSSEPSSWPGAAAIEGKAVVTSEAGNSSLHFGIAARQPSFIIDLAPKDLERVLRLKAHTLSLSIKGELAKGTSRNVVGHLGARSPAPQIIVGAHLDAYRDNPGANDNASGVAALLELARYIKGLRVPEGVGLTFVAFGAEEIGLLGSRRYIDRHADELKHCRLALALDDLGGNGPVQVERSGGSTDAPKNPGVGVIPQAYQGRAWEGLRYPWRILPPPALFAILGNSYHPDWLTKGIDEAVKGLDFPVQFTGMQGSDQMSFAQAGIATSGVNAVSARGHTPGDRPETVNIEKVGQCVETAGRIIQEIWTRPADPMADVRFLASDELRGRLAGSPEGDVAARYIADRFRAAGVKPLSGAPDYFQEVVWQRKGDSKRAKNVVGLINGREASRAEEFVLLMAHYDHVGMQTVNGVEAIYGGARDNAMGVAALLAAAETLAADPPARSILLLATTAEEEGMFGSRFFVEHPLVPLSQIVFVLNNDGAGEYEPGLWCIGGLERTTAGPLAESAGRSFGLATEPYPEKYRHLYEKGDSIAFAERGIPALTVSPGFAVKDEDRIFKYIHQPADRVDADFDVAYLMKFSKAYAALARALADAAALPTWIKKGF